MDCRVIFSGIDTLRLGVYCTFNTDWMLGLRQAMDRARDVSGSIVYKLGEDDHEVRLLPKKKNRDSSPYRVALVNRLWSAEIATWTMKDGNSTPSIMVTFRAEALAKVGAQELVDAFTKALELSGASVSEGRNYIVSRVDICADVEGWRLERGLLEVMTTRAAPGSRVENQFPSDMPNEFSVRGTANYVGYEIGSRGRRGLFCRMYAKDVQARVKAMAAWIMQAWVDAGWDGFSPVTRIEFEVNREPAMSLGLDTFEDLQKEGALEGVTAYLVTEWLRIEHPAWEVVAEAMARVTAASRVAITKQTAPPAALAAQAAGCLVSLLAVFPELDARDALRRVLHRACTVARNRALTERPSEVQLNVLREIQRELMAGSLKTTGKAKVDVITPSVASPG